MRPSGENAGSKPSEDDELAAKMFIGWRYRGLPLAVAIFCALAGCASAPPPPKPTIITATIEATAAVNPDAKGRASPIVLRWFELKSVAAFNSADFFSLWDREREILASETMARDELQLRPGEQRRFERTLQPDTQHIGVIAAFRDLERSSWRSSAAIVAHQKQPITIRLDARSVSITGK